MEFYPIQGLLQMKKIEPDNEKDLWLLHHLTMDEDVYGNPLKVEEEGSQGFLWNLEKDTFLNLEYNLLLLVFMCLLQYKISTLSKFSCNNL